MKAAETDPKSEEISTINWRAVLHSARWLFLSWRYRIGHSLSCVILPSGVVDCRQCRWSTRKVSSSKIPHVICTFQIVLSGTPLQKYLTRSPFHSKIIRISRRLTRSSTYSPCHSTIVWTTNRPTPSSTYSLGHSTIVWITHRPNRRTTESITVPSDKWLPTVQIKLWSLSVEMLWNWLNFLLLSRSVRLIAQLGKDLE